jgi:adenylosuccinate synthase
MPTLAVIGSQWGDEGKGKITDYLAEDADMVVRYQGGANAGHTIKVGDEVFALHILPSGIIREGVTSVIGNGVVIDCEELLVEMEAIRKTGRSGSGLIISDRANVVLPYHRLLDGAEERSRGSKGVGTTGRGIGPCYSDKVARAGIRMGDLQDEAYLRERLDMIFPLKERLANALGTKLEQDRFAILRSLLEYGRIFGPYVRDTSVIVNSAIEQGAKVLFEGAQGTMLDIDHGTYPYVTSSSCTAGGICSGAGVPPSAIGDVVGVTKAYTTRVGAGPFVTELHDEMGARLQSVGGEFGTTTGRPRRCGWLDLVVVRHACRLSGVTSLAMTKVDVLNDIPVIKVCVAYDIDGEIVQDFPGSVTKLARAKPVYEEVDGWAGWGGDTAAMCRKGYSALPRNLRKFMDIITTNTGTPIGIISLGKGRDETIDLRKRRWST